MPEDSKSKKLAAARKKLKAYQAKEKISEQSNTEIVQEPKHNEAEIFIPEDATEGIKTFIESNEDTAGFAPIPSHQTTVHSSNQEPNDSNGYPLQKQEELHEQANKKAFSTPAVHHDDTAAHTSTIELLINEKAALGVQLAFCKSESREKSLAAEESNVRLQDAIKRIGKLEKDLLGLQSQNSQLQVNNDHWNIVATQASNESEKYKRENFELQEFVEELKQALQAQMDKVQMLEDRLKDKECEIELNKIRINQISDVASVETDSQVEVLTQAKFIHEQQIRDLQSMVQQLEVEREQGNQQYQSYVQHLNKEITAFSEKNLKLTDENMTLVSREQSLIGHVGDLEKQLQQLMAQQKMNAFVQESQAVARRIAEDEAGDDVKQLIVEKAELIEKYKVLEAEIRTMQELINEKNGHIEELEEKIENITVIKSDSSKLLAKVESDKVAASRAVSQNEELKKQLDEVQMKLIQVTNDKVELMNLLDSEKYANREIRTNYDSMEKQIALFTEKLHFKDEEMIRLTKENNDLNGRLAVRESGRSRLPENDHTDNRISENSSCNESRRHSHSCDHSHESNDEDSLIGKCDHDHHDHNNRDHHDNHEHNHDHDSPDHNHHHHDDKHCSHEPTKEIEKYIESVPMGLPRSEAMQKLEDRFKLLMNDIANLTDEKQRLEHLVLQLQGETETIGEYIALYQSQRRVLKQREIEKNTQLHKLKSEREELRDKITLLNRLVDNLLPHQSDPNGINSNSRTQDVLHQNNSVIDPTAPLVNINNLINNISNNKQLDSNEIISAIKNIVSDIKDREKTEIDLTFTPTLDHCSCCSGKFETI